MHGSIPLGTMLRKWEALLHFSSSSNSRVSLMGSKVSVEYEARDDYPYPTANVCIYTLCLPVCHQTYQAFQHHMVNRLKTVTLVFDCSSKLCLCF